MSARPLAASLLLTLSAGLGLLSADPAEAQQIYAMGSEKLSGMYGPNPCPNVPKP